MSEKKPMIGVYEPKPARGFPAGRVRWIMRNDEYVKAAVRSSEGLRIFVVVDAGDAWEPIENCEQASKTMATYGAADLSQSGMVTLTLADFQAMAAELDRVRRMSAIDKRNATRWLKERNEARAEVDRLSKPMMVRVTMGEDQKIASIGGVQMENVRITPHEPKAGEWPGFTMEGTFVPPAEKPET